MQVLDASNCACEEASTQRAVSYNADAQLSACRNHICLQTQTCLAMHVEEVASFENDGCMPAYIAACIPKIQQFIFEKL